MAHSAALAVPAHIVVLAYPSLSRFHGNAPRNGAHSASTRTYVPSPRFPLNWILTTSPLMLGRDPAVRLPFHFTRELPVQSLEVGRARPATGKTRHVEPP